MASIESNGVINKTIRALGPIETRRIRRNLCPNCPVQGGNSTGWDCEGMVTTTNTATVYKDREDASLIKFRKLAKCGPES